MGNSSQTIIVNASTSKTGGAETIIRAFVSELDKFPTYQFILLCGLKFEKIPDNVELITKSTSGFKSVLFAIVGIRKYVKRFNPLRIISFTNLNYILKPELGITYFHQFKLLDDKNNQELKLKVYHLIISSFLKLNYFVVQAPHVKSAFLAHYPFAQNRIISCWPGFLKENSSLGKIDNIEMNSNSLNGLVPIAYDSPYKGMDIIERIERFLVQERIFIYTCLDRETKISNTSDLGAQSRQDLFNLYQKVDFLLFPSKVETVGLPIFEFLNTGKPAFVADAEYSRALYLKFDKPENFFIFKDIEHLKNLILSKRGTKIAPFDYSKGEWWKVIDLIP